MSSRIESQLARLALKLPTLNPMSAKRLEIILDRIYRIVDSRRRKRQQHGGGKSEAELDAEVEALLNLSDKGLDEALKKLRQTSTDSSSDEETVEDIIESLNFEIIRPCPVCDDCVPVKLPAMRLFITEDQVQKYWGDLKKAINSCSDCLNCIKNCQSPDCPDREQKESILEKNTKDLQTVPDLFKTVIKKQRQSQPASRPERPVGSKKQVIIRPKTKTKT